MSVGARKIMLCSYNLPGICFCVQFYKKCLDKLIKKTLFTNLSDSHFLPSSLNTFSRQPG